ncbi:hypothetical protein ACQB6R_10495 [Propionibacteriaceae bacterium G1746]|uniref:hypothetical protein n=1 Tax=Aestuariimicrobium sp. G57 TaxID=3418485 RepID=UPI003C283F75
MPGVLFGVMLLGLVGLAAVLVAYRRQEMRAEHELVGPHDDLALARSLAEADLALVHSDLNAQPVLIDTVRDLGDNDLAANLDQELTHLNGLADGLAGDLAAAENPAAVQAVTATLADIRRGLCLITARVSGEALPGTRPPCFFNPNHGPSSTVVAWTASSGSSVRVPSCDADAERLRSGASPYSRTVARDGARVAWWEAGSPVRPWARGWYRTWLDSSSGREAQTAFPSLGESVTPPDAGQQAS